MPGIYDGTAAHDMFILGLRLSLESVRDRIECRLRLLFGVPWQDFAVRDPGVVVRDTPVGLQEITSATVQRPGNSAGTHDADTPVRLHARVDDGPVVLRLLLERGRIRGPEQVDVKLRNRDVEPQVREPLQVLLERARDLAQREVALEADRVDGHTVRDEALHNVVERVRLRANPLDSVVVDTKPSK